MSTSRARRPSGSPRSAEKRIKRAFFARPAEQVAPDLLGKTLVRKLPGLTLRARIVETEAYVGPHDLACHAAKGRTARTAVMFGPPGHAYVYLIYGMYYLINIVTGSDGEAEAVLLRAAEPLDDNQAAMNGPGRLTRALSIDLSEYGLDVCTSDTLFLTDGPAPAHIASSPRVGVDYAGEHWALAPLRFFDADSRQVSKAPRSKFRKP